MPSHPGKTIEPDIQSLGRTSDTPDPGVYTRDILTAYNALRPFEGDFDKAQGLLRTVASAWLLAGIGAIGFLVLQEVNFKDAAGTAPASGLAPETAALLRQILLFVAGLGLSSLWKLDQKVYQNLLHNVFALGYWIEFRYPAVPPTRMMLYHSNYDITDSLGEFYSRPVILILIFGVINFLDGAYGSAKLQGLVPLVAASDTDGLIAALHLNATSAFMLAILVTHLLYGLFFGLSARGWGRLGGLLPAEADKAKDERRPPPPRQPFAPAATVSPPLNPGAAAPNYTAQIHGGGP